MTDLQFIAKGNFPLYFKKPEDFHAIFDAMGFSKGFRREHPSGLICYIHRCKNKKEIAPQGLTIPLLVQDINAFKSEIQPLPVYLTEVLWLKNKAVLMELGDGKKFLIIQEDAFLPKELSNLKNNSTDDIIGNGFLILNCKDPKRSAEWYENFLNCHTYHYSEEISITLKQNNHSSTPEFILFHQKENNKQNIGPLNYQHFCFTAPNIYKAWAYLKQKSKINPTWKSPQEDGIYRTVTVACPDGYRCKIYGQVPLFNLEQASKLTKLSASNIKEAIQSKKLKTLEKKDAQKINPKEEFLICEDHLMAYAFQNSPYEQSPFSFV